MTLGIRTLTDLSPECFADLCDECTDPGCLDTCHMPDRDDTANRSWLDHQGFLDDFETDEDEGRSWLWDDDVQRRRADR